MHINMKCNSCGNIVLTPSQQRHEAHSRIRRKVMKQKGSFGGSIVMASFHKINNDGLRKKKEKEGTRSQDIPTKKNGYLRGTGW